MELFDERFHLPKELPCKHYVCNNCLEELAANFHQQPKPTNLQLNFGECLIDCPQCRARHKLRLNEVPTCRLMLNFVDAYKAQHTANNSRSSQENNQIDARFNSIIRNNTNDSTQNVYPAPPPPPQPAPPHHQLTNSRSEPSSNNWYENYLRDVFNDADTDRSGLITFDELNAALRKGQPDSQFDKKTVQLILEKFDFNIDGQICFEEFKQVFSYLNQQYEVFLTIDEDGSGVIDAVELHQGLVSRNYQLSPGFSEFVVNELRKRNYRGITFDFYCRVSARFDYLCEAYANSKFYQRQPLEKYMRDAFFNQFW